MHEPWVDDDDVRDWLAGLEAGIALHDEQRRGLVANLDAARAATDAVRADPSQENRCKLSMLMHGEVIEPDPAIDEAAAAALEKTWPVLSHEEVMQRRQELLQHEEQMRIESLAAASAETQRRIALAEKITGTKYEGLPIEELMPSLKARSAT